jgi:hypothetical protein
LVAGLENNYVQIYDLFSYSLITLSFSMGNSVKFMFYDGLYLISCARDKIEFRTTSLISGILSLSALLKRVDVAGGAGQNITSFSLYHDNYFLGGTMKKIRFGIMTKNPVDFVSSTDTIDALQVLNKTCKILEIYC